MYTPEYYRTAGKALISAIGAKIAAHCYLLQLAS